MNLIRHQPENISSRLSLDEATLDQIVQTLCEWHGCGDAAMQFALYKDGELALEVAVGVDQFTGKDINTDTLFCLLSTTKALGAIVMLLLHERGFFHWNDRIAQYWPEFGKGDKEEATVAHLMCHRIGIPHLTAPWQMWGDHETMRKLVEEAQSIWPPGQRYGYHGGIYGTILNELVCRWTGKTAGAVLREEIAKPLGFPDCYIGVSESELPRIAKLKFLEEIPPEEIEEPRLSDQHPPWGDQAYYNSDALLMTCQPSGGGIANALDLAGIFNLLALEGTCGGKTFWSPASQAEATRPRNLPDKERPASPGPAACWGLGFIVAPTPIFYGTRPPGARTLGHAGASGSIAYADPDLRIAVAFLINGLIGSRQYIRYEVLGNLVTQACAAGTT
jgi:CubicO group peptidase (beta-lactamase class C family)